MFTAYFRLGCPDQTTIVHPLRGGVARSRFTPDAMINSHPRFLTLTVNIRERRGGTVCIKLPVFKDLNTVAVVRPCGSFKSAANQQVERTQSFDMPSALEGGMGPRGTSLDCANVRECFQPSAADISRVVGASDYRELYLHVIDDVPISI